MENRFLERLADPYLQDPGTVAAQCRQCGFCITACPTYLLLGDERDGPRGRIFMVRDMLEAGMPASAEVTRHIDRCLGCLACTTTCPYGVDHRQLWDRARFRIEDTFKRPLGDRLLRALLARLLPNPGTFRRALAVAGLGRTLARFLPKRLAGMAAMAPAAIPPASPVDRPQVFPAEGERRMRAALLNGCVQQVLRPAINEATIRLLVRHGCDVVVAEGARCCGALVHHLGRERAAMEAARANLVAWDQIAQNGGLDAVVINASGCGAQVKAYGHMFRDDPRWADLASRISEMTRDIAELIAELGLKRPQLDAHTTVAYHSACALQHGQEIVVTPKQLLATAGFHVLTPAEEHVCCGSAGTYNLLEPELAAQLGARKAGALEKVGPDVIATGNIGCQVQIARFTDIPVMHTAELLDWATGGPRPDGTTS